LTWNFYFPRLNSWKVFNFDCSTQSFHFFFKKAYHTLFTKSEKIAYYVNFFTFTFTFLLFTLTQSFTTDINNTNKIQFAQLFLANILKKKRRLCISIVLHRGFVLNQRCFTWKLPQTLDSQMTLTTLWGMVIHPSIMKDTQERKASMRKQILWKMVQQFTVNRSRLFRWWITLDSVKIAFDRMVISISV